MKNLKTTITTILISLITFVSFGQDEGKIWVTIKNTKVVPTIVGDEELVSSDPSFNKTMKQLNVKSVEKVFPASRTKELQAVYEITCDCDENLLGKEFKRVKSVSRIEKAPKYVNLVEPNDYNLVTNGTWALDLIGAQSAWAFTNGDTSITIGISDQNFYPNHEELIGKIKHYDQTNTATRTHGTAVAAIAAGNTNNNIGLSSIGYNSSLGLYRMNYNDALVASYAGCKVINLSWASSCSYNPYAQVAINEIYNNGTFIVASAGNGTTCGNSSALVYPASYSNVFSVSSIGSNDSHISSYGTTHQHNTKVDLVAPGYNVPLTTSPGLYTTSNGTSFAAPFVSGTVALMLSLKPDLTMNQIDSILRVTAVNIDSINSQFIGTLGSGRLNSGAAVQSVWNMVNVVDDGNNGHGNDDNGVDNSNPGNGGNNNGNHNGNNGVYSDGVMVAGQAPGNNGGNRMSVINLDKPISDDVTNYMVVDMSGKHVNLDESPSGMYFIIDNGIIVKRIFKS
jgi:hypothetical protein